MREEIVLLEDHADLAAEGPLVDVGPWTSWPPTTIVPLSIGTSALMHRRKVDLPEPEGPMMQTTSPLRTSIDMPRRTAVGPNVLQTSLQLTSTCVAACVGSACSASSSIKLGDDRETPLEAQGQARDRIAVEEEQQEDVEVDGDQQVVAGIRGEDIRGDGHDLVDADDRAQRR